jgi:radical SAM protein with 4Fe4S-binding SPASM domain
MTPPASFFIYESPANGASREKAYILLHGSEPRWLAANQTALDIARSLDAGLGVEAVAAALAARFGLSGEAARQDVGYVAERLRVPQLPKDKAPRAAAPALQSLYLHLTERCNLACPHCYLACPAPTDLPVSLVLRSIEELAALGGSHLTASGGEPLLHPEIKEILRYAAARVQVQLLSNGTLIDQDLASFLAGEVNPGIQISLDGSTAALHDRLRGPGTFRRVLRAIELLQAAGLGEQLTLSATIMRPNLPDLPKIIDLAQTLGVPRVRFLPLRPAGRAREQWSSLGSGLGTKDYEQFFDYVAGLRGAEKLALEISCGLSGWLLALPGAAAADACWCSVGRQLVVGVDGTVFPCVLLMRPEFSLGQIFHGSLGAMMRSATMAATVKALRARRLKIDRCSRCTWRNLCQSGCMGQALDKTGTVWNEDGFCDYRRRAFAEAFDRILDDFSRRGRGAAISGRSGSGPFSGQPELNSPHPGPG